MTATMYDTSVPLVQRGLTSLSLWLDKAEAFAKEKNMDVKELTEARLYEDMLPFDFQIHAATDTAAKMVSRVVGAEPETFKRDELATLAGMRARIAKVQEMIAGIDAAKYSANAATQVTLGLGAGKTIETTALEYLVGYAVPNYFFHLQTAYAILRMKGVPLGKTDYLGSFLAPSMPKEQ